jgi:S1-C subfamily serine protease
MPSTLEVLSNDLTAAVDSAGQSVVAVHARRRIPASGVVWRDGLIVAADHTVQQDDDIRVALADGRDVRASVIGRDGGTDLCLLRVSGDVTPPVARIARDPVRVGQLVLAIGRPGAAATASFGVVSAVGPAWRTWRGGRVDQFVRLDLSVYDGFSGSSLVDASGTVRGICTSGLSRGAPIAVPAATVDRVVDALLTGGGTTRAGYLGVGTQQVPLPEALRARLAPIGGKVPAAGLMIVAVQPGTSAERGGILLGDLLVGIGDEAVEDPRDVFAALGADSVGREVRVTVIRAGEPLTLSVTIDAHPARSGT